MSRTIYFFDLPEGQRWVLAVDMVQPTGWTVCPIKVGFIEVSSLMLSGTRFGVGAELKFNFGVATRSLIPETDGNILRRFSQNQTQKI